MSTDNSFSWFFSHEVWFIIKHSVIRQRTSYRWLLVWYAFLLQHMQKDDFKIWSYFPQIRHLTNTECRVCLLGLGFFSFFLLLFLMAERTLLKNIPDFQEDGLLLEVSVFYHWLNSLQKLHSWRHSELDWTKLWSTQSNFKLRSNFERGPSLIGFGGGLIRWLPEVPSSFYFPFFGTSVSI